MRVRLPSRVIEIELGRSSPFRVRPFHDSDLRPDNNAFTLARLALATSVMFPHAYDLTLPMPHLDPTVRVLQMPVSKLAVWLFFTLSGYLVTASLMRRTAIEFITARALRLVPGMWVMLIVTTFGLGLLFGTLPFADYLTNSITHEYLARNAALVIGGASHLPGVFVDHPFSMAVNGSLWTIAHEVRCYIVLAAAGALGLFDKERVLLAGLVVATFVHLLLPPFELVALEQLRTLGYPFLLGVCAYHWRVELPLSWPLAVSGVAVALTTTWSQLHILSMQIAFSYLALVFVLRPPSALRRLSATMPDYSYGIYIYAFPAQQVVIALGIGLTPLTKLLSGLVLTIPLAAASWHLIEKRVMTMRLQRAPRLVAADE